VKTVKWIAKKFTTTLNYIKKSSMLKRWELRVGMPMAIGRVYNRVSLLTVKLILVSIGIFTIQSCSTEQPVNNTDSVATTTLPSEQEEPVKTLSVTPPNSPVPKQVADSIWDGDYIEKYPNGVIKKRGYIKGGLASGDWLTFYEDGTPYSRGTYHSGYRTGYGVSWYHDGHMSSEGYYHMGKTVGKWKYWSENDHNLVEKDYGGMPDTTGFK
jgi:hypothetical protein